VSSFNEAQYFKAKATLLCGELASRLDEFVNEFPAGSPYQLIELIKQFLKGAETDMENVSEVQALKNYCALINQLAVVLDWLDNAHTEQTPKGLVQLVDEIAHALFSKAVLLVSPMSEYNYRIANLVPELQRFASQVLSTAACSAFNARLPTALYLVRFPRVERDNILNHAIFGHEFGHPIAAEFLSWYEQQPSFRDRLNRARNELESDPTILPLLTAAPDPLQRSRLLNAAVDAVTKAHRRAIEELVSDAVGVHIFGSSALFATVDILGVSSLDGPPASPELYPPSRQRIRLMLAVLTESGHIEALRRLSTPSHLNHVAVAAGAMLDFIQSIAIGDADKLRIRSEAINRIAYDWVEDTLKDALPFAASRAKAATYSCVQVDRDLVGLLDRLINEVPPNEHGTWPDLKTADWRSAILASWLYSFAQVDDPALDTSTKRKNMAITRRLASAGVEYSVLQKRYVAYIPTGTSQ
jgi:hypothetical protein